MADPVHQLCRGADDSLHPAVSRNGAEQVLNAGDVGGVVREAGSVDVSDGGEVGDRVRPHGVDGTLQGVGVEQIADMMLDARRGRRRHLRIESEDGVTAPCEQLGEMKPDEAGVARDENSQRCLPRATSDNRIIGRYFTIRNGPMHSASMSLRMKQLTACSGVSTMGSFSLKLVLSSTGVPVRSAKVVIRS